MQIPKLNFDDIVIQGYDSIIDVRTPSEFALDHLKDISFPTVIKADGLAAGKGVLICQTITEGEKALEEIFVDNAFGSAGKKVVIEDFLEGEEASFIAVVSGEEIIPLATSQDHKAAYDGDKGPNTGGMGAYAPAPVYTDEVRKKTIERIVEPMHKALSSRRTAYRGVLYVGLMIDENNDPYVVEFNVRFGDPECQITIPLIASDLGELLNAAATDKLSSQNVVFHDKHALTVVLAAENYPGSVEKGRAISGVPIPTLESWVNHAGTKVENGQLVSNGGRVLSCTGIADTLSDAADKAYALVEQIELAGSHFRRDIGHRAL